MSTMILSIQLAVLCFVVAVAQYQPDDEWECDHTVSSHDMVYRVGLRHQLGKGSAKYHHVGKRDADQPFRMFVHYNSSFSTGLPLSLATRIQKAIGKLKVFFQEVLSVPSNHGPILLERNCVDGEYYFPVSGSDDRRCKFTCENVSTCGGIAIPEEHLKACIECNGDSSTCKSVGSDGAGVINADFVLYVSAITQGSCPTTEGAGGTVASARACQLESEFDRPIAGRVNFCPLYYVGRDISDAFIMEVTTHEILHTLGFSKSLFPWWRNANGEPRTPRDKNGIPVKDENGDITTSDNTVKTVTYTNWETRAGPVSHDVTMLVTPRVQQEAQRHFSCPTLEGLELENQGGSGSVSSHWEKRLVENEGMTSSVTRDPVFSRLTFALLEDSGWYKVDYSMAGQLVWGYNQGCEFAAGSCGGFIKSQQQKNQPIAPFCDRLDERSRHGCTINRNVKSYCNLETLNELVPAEYQYLQSGVNFDSSTTDVSRIGGNKDRADYCPYQKGFSNTVCNDPDNDKGRGFDNIDLEYYGSGSRCVEQGNEPWTAFDDVTSRTANSFGAGCYKYSCSDSNVMITVSNTSYICTEKGQIINVEVIELGVTHRGTLVCPSCVDICWDDFENCPAAAELFGEQVQTTGPSTTSIPSGSSVIATSFSYIILASSLSALLASIIAFV